MNRLKLVKIKRKISPRKKAKGGDVLLLRAEVNLVANGPTGARIPLPKKYLEKLNWKKGTPVLVTLTDDGKLIVETEKPVEKLAS